MGRKGGRRRIGIAREEKTREKRIGRKEEKKEKSR